jgi:predicted alpha/beta hydrolase family esterase
MNMIFCHGVNDSREMIYNPNKGWKDWLQFIVEKEHDIIMQIPKFPHANIFDMKYQEWSNIMKHQEIGEDTILIGHSAGGGFILKYLSLNLQLKPKQVVLVAPWIDTTSVNQNGFYKDFNLIDNTINGIDLLISDNDPTPEINNSTKKICTELPGIRIHKFPGYGHFINPELPEILPTIKF